MASAKAVAIFIILNALLYFSCNSTGLNIREDEFLCVRLNPCAYGWGPCAQPQRNGTETVPNEYMHGDRSLRMNVERYAQGRVSVPARL